ncbi:hypothetical protein VTN77DRAFT_233 [Rasamsonia byssochlamydoides]|uniref:uncharacterized protein n=1 Tax=Rasamsonia byssochlamydoides TaxID=89139 RepID=UPI003743E636
MATDDFENECKALKACESSGRTPQFLGSAELRQDDTDPFPGGYLRVIVMSMVRGRPVTELFAVLIPEDYAIIRRQIAEILELMRRKGFVYSEHDTGQIFYDKPQRMTRYLTGLSHCDEQDPAIVPPITENSFEVKAFGMGWN